MGKLSNLLRLVPFGQKLSMGKLMLNLMDKSEITKTKSICLAVEHEPCSCFNPNLI